METCDVCNTEHTSKQGLYNHRQTKMHKDAVAALRGEDTSMTSPEGETPAREDTDTEGSETPPGSPYEPETAPSPGRGGIRGRMRAWGRGRRGGHAAPAPARSTGERTPKAPKGRGRRLPLDDDIADLYGVVGRRLERTPHYPTGRMLTFTALAAGTIIDDAVAGTLPDRALFQPLARSRSKWEPAMVIVGLPLVTFRITTILQRLDVARREGDTDTAGALNDQLAMLTEAFDFLAEEGLPLLAPGVEKARARQERKRQAMAQAFPELGVDGDVSPADALRSMLFAPPAGAVPEEEEPDDGIRNAEAFPSAFGADPSGAVA